MNSCDILPRSRAVIGFQLSIFQDLVTLQLIWLKLGISHSLPFACCTSLTWSCPTRLGEYTWRSPLQAAGEYRRNTVRNSDLANVYVGGSVSIEIFRDWILETAFIREISFRQQVLCASLNERVYWLITQDLWPVAWIGARFNVASQPRRLYQEIVFVAFVSFNIIYSFNLKFVFL